MSSYLLDTTGNVSVTYGQGKYVASASSEYTSRFTYLAFDKSVSSGFWQIATAAYTANTPYSGSIVTVDLIGNAYPGEWIQIQLPVSVILSTYSVTTDTSNSPSKWSVLGSRDGINWTLVDQRTGQTSWTNQVAQTFTASATQSYTFYRFVVNTAIGVQLMLYEWTLNGTEESLCVTNDSKVGVGIANPQRALEVAGDLVVSGTISGGAGLGSFRNRIINGDMRIDQRNNGAASTASDLITDRWGVVTVLRTVPTVTYTTQRVALSAGDGPATQGFQYFIRSSLNAKVPISSLDWVVLPSQKIEGQNISDLQWGTSYGSPVTVSFWYRSSVPGNHYFDISNGDYGGESYLYSVLFPVNTSAWQYYTFTIPPPPNGSSWPSTTAIGLKITFMRLGGSLANKYATDFSWLAVTAANFKSFYPAGNVVSFVGQPITVDFTGVQLERGTVATPFEFRPFAQELALCQRYFYQVGDGITGSGNGGIGPAFSTTQASIMINVPVPMRVYPTSFSATGLNLYNASTNIAITALAANGEGTAQVPAYYATVASGLTIATYYKVIGSNTNSRLQLNAEL
jgi:hypothetical protein